MRPRSRIRAFHPPVALCDLGGQLPESGYLLLTEADSDEVAGWVRLPSLSFIPDEHLESLARAGGLCSLVHHGRPGARDHAAGPAAGGRGGQRAGRDGRRADLGRHPGHDLQPDFQPQRAAVEAAAHPPGRPGRVARDGYDQHPPLVRQFQLASAGEQERHRGRRDPGSPGAAPAAGRPLPLGRVSVPRAGSARQRPAPGGADPAPKRRNRSDDRHRHRAGLWACF